jgi:hypothetical protein
VVVAVEFALGVVVWVVVVVLCEVVAVWPNTNPLTANESTSAAKVFTMMPLSCSGIFQIRCDENAPALHGVAAAPE